MTIRAATSAARQERQQAVSDHKRALILDAARAVFEAEGLEGASLRAIAKAAGYTPAALYFHFASKEAVYAALLAESIARLRAATEGAAARARTPAARLEAAALAFFAFYAENPRDLDLGFYLFRGGMKPHGLGRAYDADLNAGLDEVLKPIEDAALALGAGRAEARRATAAYFAHAVGVLLLLHTRRIRMFGQDARAMMDDYVRGVIAALAKPRR